MADSRIHAVHYRSCGRKPGHDNRHAPVPPQDETLVFPLWNARDPVSADCYRHYPDLFTDSVCDHIKSAGGGPLIEPPTPYSRLRVQIDTIFERVLSLFLHPRNFYNFSSIAKIIRNFLYIFRIYTSIFYLLTLQLLSLLIQLNAI